MKTNSPLKEIKLTVKEIVPQNAFVHNLVIRMFFSYSKIKKNNCISKRHIIDRIEIHYHLVLKILRLEN